MSLLQTLHFENTRVKCSNLNCVNWSLICIFNTVTLFKEVKRGYMFPSKKKRAMICKMLLLSCRDCYNLRVLVQHREGGRKDNKKMNTFLLTLNGEKLSSKQLYIVQSALTCPQSKSYGSSCTALPKLSLNENNRKDNIYANVILTYVVTGSNSGQ